MPDVVDCKPEICILEFEKIINQYNDCNCYGMKGVIFTTNVRFIFNGVQYTSLPWITIKNIDKEEIRGKGSFLKVELREYCLSKVFYFNCGVAIERIY